MAIKEDELTDAQRALRCRLNSEQVSKELVRLAEDIHTGYHVASRYHVPAKWYHCKFHTCQTLKKLARIKPYD